MHTVTATEASRSFAALLDEAERGETVIITRGGRRIATIGPVDASNGARFIALMASRSIDEDFASDVRAARDAVISTEPAWPDD